MKLRSMTGFGGAEAANGHLSARVELKALNGKFLDLNLRMPRSLHSKEMTVRRDLGAKIERGSATLFVTLERNMESEAEKVIDTVLAKKLFAEIHQLQEDLAYPPSNILDAVLAFPGVINTDDAEELSDDDWKLVEDCISRAFEEFDKFREQEGKSLAEELEKFTKNIANGLPELEKYEGERIKTLRERIHTNLQNNLEDEKVDKDRFEQELIYYIEKMDFSEEKSRLSNHCNYFLEVLKKEPSGKKLGFIAQEMGREINTLGAKANHFNIQQVVVMMKDELEKIKEQVNNVL